MKTSKSILNFNHISPNLAESEKNELEVLYNSTMKILALQNDFLTFRKIQNLPKIFVLWLYYSQEQLLEA